MSGQRRVQLKLEITAGGCRNYLGAEAAAALLKDHVDFLRSLAEDIWALEKTSSRKFSGIDVVDAHGVVLDTLVGDPPDE